MKLNSVTFKRKLYYFLPFVQAYVLHSLKDDAIIFRCDLLLKNGDRSYHYCSVPISTTPVSLIKSISYTLFEELSYKTEEQFFISFLASCSSKQLFVALDEFRNSFCFYDGDFFSSFLSLLASRLGDSKIFAYVSREQKS